MKVFNQLKVGKIYNGNIVRKAFPGINSNLFINYNKDNLQKIINYLENNNFERFAFVFVNTKNSRKRTKLDFANHSQIIVALKADSTLFKGYVFTDRDDKDFDKMQKKVPDFYRQGTYMSEVEKKANWLLAYKKEGLAFKPETKKHFGDIIKGLGFNEQYKSILESYQHTSAGKIKSLKLVDFEKRICEIVANLANDLTGYKYRGTALSKIRNQHELYSLVKLNIMPYLVIKENIYVSEDPDDFILTKFLQPYIEKHVLYDCVYNNPEIDVNEVNGLLDTGVTSYNAGPNAKKYLEILMQDRKSHVNTSYIYYCYFPHSYDTNYKIAEVFLKNALLLNLMDSNYFSDTRMKKKTKEHFGDILREL